MFEISIEYNYGQSILGHRFRMNHVLLKKSWRLYSDIDMSNLLIIMQLDIYFHSD